MYIFTTLEFPTHNSDFHLLTTRVNAKYLLYTKDSCMDNSSSSDGINHQNPVKQILWAVEVGSALD